MPTTQDIPAPERQRAVETCRALLAGQLGIIEGARALAELPHLHASGTGDDPELGVLDALSTETAHISLGEARKELDETTLAEQDAERARMEMLVRDDVLAACQRLLRRLGGA